MCATCGCSAGGSLHPTRWKAGSEFAFQAVDAQVTMTPGRDEKTIRIEEGILRKNDILAEANRIWLAERNVCALNLVSSPGAGKTTLLERTIRDLKDEMLFHVVEGDQATAHDSERIRKAGCEAVQINTGTGCHLDAEMVDRALEKLSLGPGSMVMIENVGNLVCPALFDLGEKAKVVILSVTEGEDKPLKYPHMFQAADVLVLNKTDLLPHLQFDVDLCLSYARRVNPELRVLQVSATCGDGLGDWYDWLRGEKMRAARHEGEVGSGAVDL